MATVMATVMAMVMVMVTATVMVMVMVMVMVTVTVTVTATAGTIRGGISMAERNGDGDGNLLRGHKWDSSDQKNN